MNFNFHTHTRFCDGSDEPEEYVKAALELGFHFLGFSGHAPVPMKNHFAIPENELENYCREIRSLQKKYSGKINIFLSLEIDFIPEITQNFKYFIEKCNLDYVIGSVHLVKNKQNNGMWFIDGPKPETYDQGLKDVFENDIRLAVGTYFQQINEMIINQKFDIIGHFDKIKMHNKNRYFSEEEKWYKDEITNTLKLISDKKIIVEINTRGIYKKRSNSLFPGKEVLKQIYKMGIPVTLSSDAHKPSELSAYFDESVEIIKDIGFRELMIFTKNGWKTQRI
ncbi:MAG: histidinol-phosphatase [Bacteroidales bacterium]|nr:histidinol-phosphatase [Bacteroidales bacterium]